MSKKKIEKVLEKTKKSLVKDWEETRKRLVGFKKKTTILAIRVKKEAEKVAKISRLRIEILPLSQKKDRKLKDLGKRAYRLIESGKITPKDLKSLSEEIRGLETEIRGKEKEIKKLRK